MGQRYDQSAASAATLGLTVQPLPVQEFAEAFAAIEREPPRRRFYGRRWFDRSEPQERH